MGLTEFAQCVWNFSKIKQVGNSTVGTRFTGSALWAGSPRKEHAPYVEWHNTFMSTLLVKRNRLQ